MEAIFWIIGIAFAGYVLWVLLTSSGPRTRKGKASKGGGWFGGGWDGGDGGGGN